MARAARYRRPSLLPRRWAQRRVLPPRNAPQAAPVAPDLHGPMHRLGHRGHYRGESRRAPEEHGRAPERARPSRRSCIRLERAVPIARPFGSSRSSVAVARTSPGRAAGPASLRERRCSKLRPMASSHESPSCLSIGCDGFGRVALLLIVRMGRLRLGRRGARIHVRKRERRCLTVVTRVPRSAARYSADRRVIPTPCTSVPKRRRRPTPASAFRPTRSRARPGTSAPGARASTSTLCRALRWCAGRSPRAARAP